MERFTHFVIELKTGKFQPEYAGKLNFYVPLVDDKLRRDPHVPTVGILICGSCRAGAAAATPNLRIPLQGLR